MLHMTYLKAVGFGLLVGAIGLGMQMAYWHYLFANTTGLMALMAAEIDNHVKLICSAPLFAVALALSSVAFRRALAPRLAYALVAAATVLLMSLAMMGALASARTLAATVLLALAGGAGVLLGMFVAGRRRLFPGPGLN